MEEGESIAGRKRGREEALAEREESVVERGEVEGEVKGHGSKETEVLVGEVWGQEGDGHLTHAKAAVKQSPEKGNVVGQRGDKAGSLPAMQRPSDSTLSGIEGEATPITICEDLRVLALEAGDGGREESKVISKGRGGEGRGLGVSGGGKARRGVPMTANREPAEEGLKKDEEKERGESVPLNSATGDGDGGRTKGGGAVEKNMGGGIGVKIPKGGDKIRGVAEVGHNLEQASMGDGVKSVGEINVEDKQVPRVFPGVIEGEEETQELAMSVTTGAEALLVRVEKVVGFRVRGDKRGEEASPTLVQCRVEPNGAFVGKEVGRAALVEKDGVRRFPVSGGRLRQPHEEKQEVEGRVERGGHKAEEFIGHTVGTRRLVVRKARDEVREEGRVLDEGEKGGGGRGRGRKAEGIRGILAVPRIRARRGFGAKVSPRGMEVLVGILGQSQGIGMHRVSNGITKNHNVGRVGVGVGIRIDLAVGAAGGGAEEARQAATMGEKVARGTAEASETRAGGAEQGVGAVEPREPRWRGV